MAVQPHFVGSMTLKALLEDPNLKNPPPITQSSSQLKVKKEGDSTELPQFKYGSAFLGPNLWDKTYDGLDFNLEYMDLDEFLSENGMAAGEEAAAKTNTPSRGEGNSPASPAMLQMPISPRQFIKTPPMSPSQYMSTSPAGPPTAAPLASTPNTSPYHSGIAEPVQGKKSPTPPVSPLNVEFQMSEQDVALSSIPGHEEFDPRKRNFSEEELKPQPVIKKSKKIFVPEDLKDDKYWARRHKNNYAAKRSRDARRVKENQIAMRAAFLEKENSALKDEVSKLRKENVSLKTKVTKYEMPSGSESLTSSSILGIP